MRQAITLNKSAKQNKILYVFSCLFFVLFFLLLQLNHSNYSNNRHFHENKKIVQEIKKEIINEDKFNTEYDVTIVTAYFVIPGHKTKHSNEWYLTEGLFFFTSII